MIGKLLLVATHIVLSGTPAPPQQIPAIGEFRRLHNDVFTPKPYDWGTEHRVNESDPNFYSDNPADFPETVILKFRSRDGTTYGIDGQQFKIVIPLSFRFH